MKAKHILVYALIRHYNSMGISIQNVKKKLVAYVQWYAVLLTSQCRSILNITQSASKLTEKVHVVAKKKKNIYSIEQVQRLDTKMLHYMNNLSHKERLQKLKLSRSICRPLRENIREVYIILNRIYNPKRREYKFITCIAILPVLTSFFFVPDPCLQLIVGLLGVSRFFNVVLIELIASKSSKI